MQSTVSTMSHWTCMNTYACLSLVNEFLTCRRIFCSISSSSHLPVCLESGTAPFHQAAQACATLSWFIPRCSGNVERFLLPFPVHFVIPLAWKPSPPPISPSFTWRCQSLSSQEGYGHVKVRKQTLFRPQGPSASLLLDAGAASVMHVCIC